MDQIAVLFALFDAYRSATGLSEARVSTLVLGGGKRSAQIRLGSDIGVRRLKGAFSWFADNWPEGADWPHEVPRPAAPEADLAGSAAHEPTPTAEPASFSGGAA
jgi:hypothetical protein